MLASHYGDVRYWLDPDLPDELLATALDLLPVKEQDSE